MVLRRRAAGRPRLRRLIVVGALVSGLTALRNLMLTFNEWRFSDLVAEPGGDRRLD